MKYTPILLLILTGCAPLPPVSTFDAAAPQKPMPAPGYITCSPCFQASEKTPASATAFEVSKPIQRKKARKKKR